MRIVGVCGSLQSTSSNLTLLEAVAHVLPDGTDYDVFDGIRDLPLLNPDIERDGASPDAVLRWRAAVLRWRAAVVGADALLRTLAAVSARVVGGTAIARGPDEHEHLRVLLDSTIAEIDSTIHGGDAGTVRR